jgi:hypothetical protein
MGTVSQESATAVNNTKKGWRLARFREFVSNASHG